MQHHQYTKTYHRCVQCKRSYFRKHTVGRGRHQSSHIHCTPFEDDPPPIFSCEPYPSLASQNSVKYCLVLVRVEECDVFKQSDTALDLPCRKLAHTRCGVEWAAASSPVCSYCSEDSSLITTEIRPVPNAIVISLKNLLVQ